MSVPANVFPTSDISEPPLCLDGTVLRDCGFAAFREGIAKGKTGCEENAR